MTSDAAPAARSVPLVVDLDGTLIKTDMFVESFLGLLKQNPLFIFIIPFWLMKGRVTCKREIAIRVHLDIPCLPYNHDVLAFLREEQQRGRTLILATASHMIIARKIADHLGIFSVVLASHDPVNLKGYHKLRALQDHLGDQPFDYAGDAYADLNVWAHANAAIIVEGSKDLIQKAQKVTVVNRIFHNPQNKLVVFLKAIRVNQWIKNMLIFIPVFTAHKLADARLLIASVYAFLALSLFASSAYLLNDLWDIEDDRHHLQKKRRPLAAGDLSLLTGMVMIPLFLLGGVVMALLVPGPLLWILGVYYVTTVLYSLYLKRVVLVDVMVLALLYTLRIIAGGIATGLALSQWLLAFSIFIFVSLAFVKRFAELYALRKNAKEIVRGRGYRPGDLEQLANLGSASGYLSVLILALYINGPEAHILYKSPKILWGICLLLLYWISRVWLLAHRGQVQDDPLLFAMKDSVTYLIGLGIIGIILMAIG